MDEVNLYSTTSSTRILTSLLAGLGTVVDGSASSASLGARLGVHGAERDGVGGFENCETDCVEL
jgi:hypothetical protein